MSENEKTTPDSDSPANTTPGKQMSGAPSAAPEPNP